MAEEEVSDETTNQTTDKVATLPAATPTPEPTTASTEAAAPENEAEKTAGEKITGERVLDIAFGLGILAAEALEKAIGQLGERAKTAQQYAPAVLDAVQEKGRPAREKLLTNLKDSHLFHPMKPTGEEEGGSSSAGSGSAEDEIRTLEERVKELEKQVDAPDAGPVPTVDLRFELRAAAAEEPASEETPAERATLDFAEQPHAVDDSPYSFADEVPGEGFATAPAPAAETGDGQSAAALPLEGTPPPADPVTETNTGAAVADQTAFDSEPTETEPKSKRKSKES